jgi:hypothetical protein
MTFNIANSSFTVNEAVVANYHLTDEKFICLLEALQNAGIEITASIIDNSKSIAKEFEIIEDYIAQCSMVV